MEHHLQPGTVLAGKYRIERVLGQGGMGVVVAATHIQLGQRVALKFLLPGAVGNGEAVARFLREARTAVQLQSENVARVSDVGAFEDGAPFIVMEYLEGRDLSEVLSERGPLPIELAVDYVLQALDAIAEAHSLGMVHRDLKPSNLFLARRRDGTEIIKVLDFGISKASGEGPAANLTATSAVMGSPLYMSPEQVRSSKDVDARSDIWAVGVILHELLAGGPPFSGETMIAVLAMIAADPPPPLREKRRDAPPGLEHLVLRCLEKDRTRRFTDVAELAHALSAFAPEGARARAQRISKLLGKPAAVSASVNAARPDERLPTGGAWSNTSESLQGRARRRPLYLAVGGLVVASLGFAGFLASQQHKDVEAAPNPLPQSASAPAHASVDTPAVVPEAASAAPVATVVAASAAPSAVSTPPSAAEAGTPEKTPPAPSPARRPPARVTSLKQPRSSSAAEAGTPSTPAPAQPPKPRQVPEPALPKPGLFDDTK